MLRDWDWLEPIFISDYLIMKSRKTSVLTCTKLDRCRLASRRHSGPCRLLWISGRETLLMCLRRCRHWRRSSHYLRTCSTVNCKDNFTVTHLLTSDFLWRSEVCSARWSCGFMHSTSARKACVYHWWLKLIKQSSKRQSRARFTNIHLFPISN